MRSIEEDHIHAKLMKLYPEVLESLHWGILVFFFLMDVIATEVAYGCIRSLCCLYAGREQVTVI